MIRARYGSGKKLERRVAISNENPAEVAEKYLGKGRTAYIEGTLQTHKWTDQSGQERYTTEVVVPRFRGEPMPLAVARSAPATCRATTTVPSLHPPAQARIHRPE